VLDRDCAADRAWRGDPAAAQREAVMRRLALAILLVLPCAFATPAALLAAENPVNANSELIARKTVAELEAANTLRPDQLSESDRTGPRASIMLKPFAFLNDKWEALKARMQPGDELWTFASSPQSWRDLAGRAGIALVRNGQIIERLVTMMN
jgi:hypothetical protein